MDGLGLLIADQGLEVHTPIEEQIFYPVAHDLSEELAEVVNEGVQEHPVVDVLIEETCTLKPGDAEWVAKVPWSSRERRTPCGGRGTKLFPEVRSATDVVTRKGGGTRFEAMKAERGAPTPTEAAALTTKELRQRASQQQILAVRP